VNSVKFAEKVADEPSRVALRGYETHPCVARRVPVRRKCNGGLFDRSIPRRGCAARIVTEKGAGASALGRRPPTTPIINGNGSFTARPTG
jgi:hypothetical protein